ncbi:MAG: hypothetical protein JKY01_03595 [Pseudomonadales bacterium]|nr:hypothetical protein [Pseudomonadales bacterium]
MSPFTEGAEFKQTYAALRFAHEAGVILLGDGGYFTTCPSSRQCRRGVLGFKTIPYRSANHTILVMC